MKVAQALVVALPLAALCGCSGGGGGGSTTQVSSWAKFRHDGANSGQGIGFVEPTPDTTPVVKWRTQVDQGATASAIVSSPALDEDGTVYVGSAGGTLAAINPSDGTLKWSLSQCEIGAPTSLHACVGSQPLGPLVSSPAVYKFDSLTNIFIGSSDGTLYIIQDDGTTRTCTLCFKPASADFGSDATVMASRFVSSPTFTASADTGSITAVFVGASIDLQRSGTARTVGKLYAVNTDGTVRWQFPRSGDLDIRAVTSSPALGLDNAVYFTTDDNLYALTAAGQLRWTFPLPAAAEATAPFAASPLALSLIYAASGGTGGTIVAVNPDGSFRWRVSSPDGSGFIASLASGNPVFLTPTTTPSPVETPTPPPAGATPTPTPTLTPLAFTQAIFGVTGSGTFVTIDVATGAQNVLLGSPPVIAGPVVSSPALSADSFLIVGSADGKLHIINTATGAEPSGWPLQLAPLGMPIRSSPCLDSNGTIYVGADDGSLYAVGGGQ